MAPELLWSQFPYLWHMAEPGSWASISEAGLLSTSALLDRYGVGGDSRAAIEAERRSASCTITRAGLPDAVIRDQKPMSDDALRKCLEDGLTPAEWYRILNARTFFWLSRARLRKLLGARAYRDKPQTVLTLSTRSLVAAHLGRVELSPINSGSTLFNPVPRGRGTFRPVAEYDFNGWCEKRTAKDAIVELVVRDGVPDVGDHVLAVHDCSGGTAVEVWRRPGVAPDIGP